MIDKIKNIFKILLKNLVFILIMMFLLFEIGNIFIINYADVEINDSTFYQNTAQTNIYDNQNKLVYSISSYDIEDVKYEDISPYYFTALISLEDNRFQEHSGIDYPGMFKAVFRSLSSDSQYGGSSITMQLAKNVYMQDWLIYDENGVSKHDSNPIQYKLTQMSIAKQIEQKYSKEDIITHYANSVFYGDGGYGIKSASQTFFHKSPKDLTIREATIVAAIPNRPYGLSPYDNLDNLNTRVDYGLSQMLENGYINVDEYNSAMSEDVTFYPKEDKSKEDAYLMDYLDVILDELYELNPDLNLYTADLDIYTYLDISEQQNMEEVIKDMSYKQNGIQQGSIVINPNNGGIMAVGNRTDEEEILRGYNLATELQRQPGSSIKPVIDYAPAIEYLGYNANSSLYDGPISYTGGPNVNNYCNCYYGNVSLSWALQQSLNTPALKLFQEVQSEKGLDWYKEYMRSLGFDDVENLNEAYSIGGFEYGTSPLEMAGAYQIFANGGTYYEPHAIKSIKVKENSPYYKVPENYVNPINGYQVVITQINNENEPFTFDMNLVFQSNSKQIISKNTADIITDTLKVNNSNSLLYTQYIDTKLNVSGKTGTSNQGNYAHDTWTVVYNTDKVVATWNGFENNEGQINESENDVKETSKRIIEG